MKKTTVLIAAGFALFAIIFALLNTSSSTKPVEHSVPTKYTKYDTDHNGVLDDFERQRAAADMTDSIINQCKESVDSSFAKNSELNSNIQITKVTITHNQYSSQWDNIKISYKNNSKKTVKAIEFRWYDVKDVFDEEVSPTYNGGWTEETILPNKLYHGEWETYENKIASAKVYVQKIMYTDGTKWENKVN